VAGALVGVVVVVGAGLTTNLNTASSDFLFASKPAKYYKYRKSKLGYITFFVSFFCCFASFQLDNIFNRF
jgi:hypothetical protein